MIKWFGWLLCSAGRPAFGRERLSMGVATDDRNRHHHLAITGRQRNADLLDR
jgi:hypothetical protein